MKKAIFFDIDGTLWDEHNTIPKSTILGIEKLQKAGNLAFICSGRSRAYIFAPHLLSLGFDGIVAGCGTYIENGAGDVLFYKELDDVLVNKTLARLADYHIPVILEGKGHLYLDMEDFASGPEEGYSRKLKSELGDELLPIKGHKGTWEVSKMSVSIAGKTGYEPLFEELSENYDILVHNGQAAELVPKGFSKASGIKEACKLYGIDRENTYAFGDGVNDLEMLRYVETGIAMGNGTKEAKEAADYVTDALFSDGVYHALEYFGLI